jgi:hypothetical protein
MVRTRFFQLIDKIDRVQYILLHFFNSLLSYPSEFQIDKIAVVNFQCKAIRVQVKNECSIVAETDGNGRYVVACELGTPRRISSHPFAAPTPVSRCPRIHCRQGKDLIIAYRSWVATIFLTVRYGFCAVGGLRMLYIDASEVFYASRTNASRGGLVMLPRFRHPRRNGNKGLSTSVSERRPTSVWIPSLIDCRRDFRPRSSEGGVIMHAHPSACLVEMVRSPSPWHGARPRSSQGPFSACAINLSL